jgi:hypothetical protein
MKITGFSKTVLLVTASVAIVATTNAQSLTYSNGDLFLGFRASGGTGATQDVLVDIGQASTFLTASAPISLSLGDLQSKLASTFGANWNTRSDLFFSVSGTNLSTDTANTLYATIAQAVPGSEPTTWLRRSGSAQSSTNSLMTGMANQYNNYSATVANPAVIQNTTDANSYASFQPGGANAGPAPGASFAVYNPTIEGTFANGTSGVTLDVVRLLPSTTQNQHGVDIGDFTIDNSANVIFTPDSFEAVPEPSTIACAAMGTLVLLLRLRRRSSKA